MYGVVTICVLMISVFPLGLQLWGGGGARKMKLSTPPTPAAAQAETAHTWDPPPVARSVHVCPGVGGVLQLHFLGVFSVRRDQWIIVSVKKKNETALGVRGTPLIERWGRHCLRLQVEMQIIQIFYYFPVCVAESQCSNVNVFVHCVLIKPVS